MRNRRQMSEAEKPKKNITFLSFIVSLFAAWFGVSSQKQRERDFSQGKFSYFIIGGIIFVIIFVSTIVLVVNFILSDVGV